MMAFHRLEIFPFDALVAQSPCLDASRLKLMHVVSGEGNVFSACFRDNAARASIVRRLLFSSLQASEIQRITAAWVPEPHGFHTSLPLREESALAVLQAPFITLPFLRNVTLHILGHRQHMALNSIAHHVQVHS